MKMIELRRRSIIKGVTWRVTATIITIIIVFLFTGEIKLALGVGLIEAIAKLVLYYIHERIWNKISWGVRAAN